MAQTGLMPQPQLQLGSNISGATKDAAGNIIEESSYYLSVNGSEPWYKVSGPKGDAGNQGPAGSTGATGPAGEKGDSFFKDVKGTDDSGNLLDVITFTLASQDGSGKNLTFEVLRYKSFKIGTGEGNGAYPIVYNSASSTTLHLSLPSDFKAADYTGIMAQVISEQGTGTAITTRTATVPWTVTVKKPNFNTDGSCKNDATVTVTPPTDIETGDKAVLEVTLIGNDGGKLVATRALKAIVYNSIQAGDFYMSDGALVSKDATLTDAQKKDCTGIVFWVGDPTESYHTTAYTGSNTDGTTLTDFGDPALKAEHSGCTHGLVVALKDATYNSNPNMHWQESYSSIESWRTGDKSTVTDKSYLTSVNSYVNATDPANKLRGYNNTIVMRAYNTYCKESSTDMSYQLIHPIEAIDAYAKLVPSPDGSSGWYFPSAKELMLLCGKDVNNIYSNKSGGTDSKALVNIQFKDKLDVGSCNAFDDGGYWSSTEYSTLSYTAWYVNFSSGNVDYYGTKYSNAYRVRPILAF
ncbi:MAG: DUF1566 domain-containing protein [Bacteroides sp.]|nr:DUF1566 domain-containing protein [Bacteroides sp.]